MMDGIVMEPVDCCPVCGGEGTLDIVNHDKEKEKKKKKK